MGVYRGWGFERAILVVSLPAIPYSNNLYYKFVAKVFPLTPAKAEETEARWTENEDIKLVQEFRAKIPIERIARTHVRTEASILKRLASLGLL